MSDDESSHASRIAEQLRMAEEDPDVDLEELREEREEQEDEDA